MNFLKKSMLSAVALATLTAASISFSTAPASAGYHYSGGYHTGKVYRRVCGWKWTKWYDGYRWHRTRKWICR